MFAIESYAAGTWSALPCESAPLRLVSLACDTLTLGGLDYGALAVRQPVRVRRAAETVFSGTVARLGRDTRRGRRQRQTAVVKGLVWHAMERTLFTQPWMMWVETEEHPEGVWALRQTGRVILNQSDSGAPVSVRAQLTKILGRCAASAPSIADAAADTETFADFPDLVIPFDEARDLYCDLAIQKELRFLPRAASRVDYAAAGGPFLRFRVPGPETADAGWLADYAAAGKLVVVGEEETDDAPAGVQIEVETGGSRRNIVMQEAGDVADPAATLRACLSLAGRESASSYRYLDVVTEDAPATSSGGSVDFTSGAAAEWLAAHCSSLKGVAVADIRAGAISRSGEADKGLYPRITSVPLSDLERAGIRARLETFSADVNIAIASDDGTTVRTEISKMRVVLTLITTSAETKRYSWQDSYSYTAAETAPDGLAAALLGHLADCGRSATVAVRLAAGLDIPRPGDCRGGLPCQSVEIDLKRETAVAVFGAPSHLSAADLAAVLSGFRNLRRASVWGSRRSGEASEEDAEPAAIVCPVSEETFSLGSFERLAASKGGKTADMNPADLAKDGAAAKFRKIVYQDQDGNTKNAQILATEIESGAGEETPKDPCADHPGGGDGVAGGGYGGGAASDGGGGVAAGGSDSGGGAADGCTTQCSI